MTTGVGGKGRHNLALVVEQVDLDPADAGFAGILNAIPVQVVEHDARHRTDLPVAKVGAG